MPTFTVQHLTQYSYEEPVSVCHHLAHLLPRESPRHFWAHAEVDIAPVPAIRAERRDYFGNRMIFFSIQEPHHNLDVNATSQVEVLAPPAASQALFSTLPWEQVRTRSATSSGPADYESLEAFQFTFASPYVLATPGVADYAAPSFAPSRPVLDAALDLSARIYRDFKYDAQSTTVSTTLPEIMQTRAGVCQDFAHLLIGCLRAFGLPARYVSGYLLSTPAPGQPRLAGADASHAWVSLHIPDYGWVDLDPTNNCIPSDKHITIAWGRDFGDVSPLRGVILGGGKHTVHVSVDVSPNT